MNLPSEQGTRVYHHINIGKTALSIFFPSNLNGWFNLDINIRISELITLFKCKLLSFIRPVKNSIYNIFQPKGLKLLTRLRLDLSHLNAHRL